MADDTKNNDDQAKALVEALGPSLVEAILPKIAESVSASVEEQIKGIKEKNDELLGKLADVKNASANDKLLAAAEAAMQGRKTDTLEPFKRESLKAVQITKSDARDVRTYRAAKAEAEKRGVGLEIIEDQ